MASPSQNKPYLCICDKTDKSGFMEENQIVIYQTEDGQTQIDVRLEKRYRVADSGSDGRTVSDGQDIYCTPCE